MYIQYQFKNGQILYQEVTNTWEILKFGAETPKPPLVAKTSTYMFHICKYVYMLHVCTFLLRKSQHVQTNSWLKNEIYSWIVSLQCQLLVHWSLSRRFLLIDLKLSTSMSSADRLTDNTPLPGQLSAHCSRIKVNAARPKPFRVDNWTCRLIQISSYPIVSSPFPFWFSLLFKQKVLQISVICW